MPRSSTDPLTRLLARTTLTEGGCLIFTGKPDSLGYSRVSVGKNGVVRGHRVVWEHANGPVPDDHHVHHTCGNRLCVALKHLTLVDRAEHGREHSVDRWRDHDYDAPCSSCGSVDILRYGRRRYCRPCTRASQARYREARRALVDY